MKEKLIWPERSQYWKQVGLEDGTGVFRGWIDFAGKGNVNSKHPGE